MSEEMYTRKDIQHMLKIYVDMFIDTDCDTLDWVERAYQRVSGISDFVRQIEAITGDEYLKLSEYLIRVKSDKECEYHEEN